jgi:hypothetical protein
MFFSISSILFGSPAIRADAVWGCRDSGCLTISLLGGGEGVAEGLESTALLGLRNRLNAFWLCMLEPRGNGKTGNIRGDGSDSQHIN